MDLNSFKTDLNKVEDGVWVDVGDGRLLIARFGNKKFQRYLQTLMAPYKRMQGSEEQKDAIAEKQLIKAIAKYVVLGWEGMVLDGQELDYSEQSVIDILSNPQFVDFRNWIVTTAQDGDLFRAQEVEGVVGE